MMNLNSPYERAVVMDETDDENRRDSSDSSPLLAWSDSDPSSTSSDSSGSSSSSSSNEEDISETETCSSDRCHCMPPAYQPSPHQPFFEACWILFLIVLPFILRYIFQNVSVLSNSSS